MTEYCCGLPRSLKTSSREFNSTSSHFPWNILALRLLKVSEIAFTGSTFLWSKLPKCLNPHVNSYRTGRPSVFKRSHTLFTYKTPLVISDSLAPVKASAQFIHACSHVSYLSLHLHYLLLFNHVTPNCFFVSLLPVFLLAFHLEWRAMKFVGWFFDSTGLDSPWP